MHFARKVENCFVAESKMSSLVNKRKRTKLNFGKYIDSGASTHVRHEHIAKNVSRILWEKFNLSIHDDLLRWLLKLLNLNSNDAIDSKPTTSAFDHLQLKCIDLFHGMGTHKFRRRKTQKNFFSWQNLVLFLCLSLSLSSDWTQ